MKDIEYPYMPDDRYLQYISSDHPHMQEAARARVERAGDPLFPVGAALVRDGVVLVLAGNGFNKGGKERHVCPRIVQEVASGEGYELCDKHDSAGHAEPMLMAAAQEAGVETDGADVYMYGHWWSCESCWNSMIQAGIRDVYVTDDAHEQFSREAVYAETLKPRLKSISLDGFDEAWVEFIREEAEKIGVEVVEFPGEMRVVKHEAVIDCFVGDESEPVYTIDEMDPCIAARQICHVLKQV